MKQRLHFLKRLSVLFMFLGLMAMPGVGWGQYAVNFDGASDGTHATNYGFTDHTLNEITWTGVQVIIPTPPLAADWYNGVRSARLRGYSTSHMTMTSNKANGIGTISFNYRRYGTDSQVTWRVEYSTNDGGSWTQVGSDFTAPASDDVQVFSETVNVSGNARIRIIHVSGGNTSTNRRLNIDDLLITDYTGSSSTITVTPATLTGFTYILGSGPSAEQSFTISGSNLTNNISIAPPTNYEISTATGGSFVATNPVTLNHTGGTVASTTIYVRLKAGLSVNTYNSEVITASSAGADNKTVTCSGSVTAPPPPTITVSPTSLPGFTYVLGSGPSTEQSFTISGANLTNNISIASPTNYEISTATGGSFVPTNPVTLNHTGGTVASTTIYVRLKAGLSVNTYNSEEITASSAGADNKTVTCSGSVTAPPPPDAPVATAASGTGATSFTANWGASAGATGYFLDIYTKTAGGNATDLFISEYIEGSSNNKAIEIFNGTGSTINLADYVVVHFNNGASRTTGTRYSLTFTNPTNIANGETFVIVKSDANATFQSLADLSSSSSVMGFNGDDALAIYRASDVSGTTISSEAVEIDIFGRIGNDPGSAWTGDGGYSTADKTLVRKSSVTGGVTVNPTGTGATAFTTLTTEWDLYDVDVSSYLGSHTFAGGSSSTFVSGFENLSVGNVTSYEITGLDPNTTYYYVVRAANASGASGNSNEIEVTTLAAIGLPVVTNTSVSGVGETSATLGGEITSDGGSAITERGTVWSLTPAVTISNNKLTEGGTSTGIFSHSRSGLPSGTLIYFRAYAINANGTSLSEEDSFTTLAAEPANHATGFSGISIAPTQNTITLTWTNPSPASESYLIKGVVGVGSVTDPVDLTPESDALLVKNLAATAESYTFTGLASETTYTFKIYPYNGTDVNVNYLVTGAPSASATTSAVTIQTYAWIGADAGSWATAANWNPSRTSPENTDILQFNDGATKTITGVTSQTIGKISVSNNTKITLQTATTATLAIAGGTGDDLLLEEGSELNASGSNAILIALSTGATASIDGAMTFASGAHKLTSADAGGITFNSGAVFTAGTGFSGNAFGTSTPYNAVVFSNGSTYIHTAGSNPFGATQPNSVVVFQSGSLFKQTQSGSPALSGRTYANLEIDVSAFSQNMTGTAAFSVDNLTITNATLVGINLTGTITINGNISVANGTLSFTPATAMNINFSGSSIQTISGNGTLSFGGNATLNINNAVVLDKNATISGAMNIAAGKSFTINPTRQLTVSGALTNNAGNSGLIIKSDATGTGSLIHNTADVPATIERYITGNTNLTELDYHLVSVPLNASVTAAQFLGSYLYQFNTGTGAWESMGQLLTTELPVNKGYMIYYPNSSITYNFSGQLNNGSFTTSTPMTSADQFSLVPNPYPSAIDWDAAAGWDKTNIRNAIWIWNPILNNYAAYGADAGTNGGTRYIPAGQAFFVKSNAASPLLTMNNSVRLHNEQSFYKNTETQVDYLSVTVNHNSASDEAVFRFRRDAVMSLDDTDVDKLFGSASAPQLYSLTSEERQLSINSLPYSDQTQIIPLGFELQSQGTITLNFNGIESFVPTTSIFLEDLLTGQMINLREQPAYSFAHVQGNDALRFNLHFMGVTSTDEIKLPADHRMWSQHDRIYISIPDKAGERARIELFDLLGNKLDEYSLTLGSPTVLHSRYSGIVIVRAIAGNRVYTSKLFIR